MGPGDIFVAVPIFGVETALMERRCDPLQAPLMERQEDAILMSGERRPVRAARGKEGG